MMVITSVVPPSGWHYVQPLTTGTPQHPQSQRIEGSTYNNLIERILLFRQQHLELVASGTATRERCEADYMFYLCGHWPQNCSSARGEKLIDPAVPTGRVYTRPITRVEDWIRLLSSQHLEWVDSATAVARARVCIGCPLNQKWATGCGSCNENVQRRSLLIRGSHETGFENQLRACLAYGWLNELAIWLKDQFVGPMRKPIVDCWKLKESHG